MRKDPIRVLVVLTAFTVGAWAQCTKDNREEKKGGILVTDFTITGTKALSASDVAGMGGDFIGACFNDDSEELEERVRAEFQNRGYFKADVKHISFKADDPLGSPKKVTMEADVDEGPLFRLNQITFLENHAFSTDELRAAFSLKKGDVFSRRKVASGLEGVRKLYGKQGYLDMYCIPDTRFSAGADLIVTMNEGPQYHMGKMEILADKTLADRMQLAWKLREGVVFDWTYIDKYIGENHDLLPGGFGRQEVKLGKNCPDAVVDVRMTVEDKDAASRAPMKDVPCEKKEEKGK